MIVDADELVAYCHATEDDAEQLEALERAAVDVIQDLTGSYQGPRGEVTTRELWPAGGLLQLPDEPVEGTLTLERWNGSAWEAVGASEYRVDGAFLWANTSYEPGLGRYPYRATYQAGHTAGNAPEAVKQAVRMLVAHWWENPEAAVAGTITEEMELGVKLLLRGKTRVVV